MKYKASFLKPLKTNKYKAVRCEDDGISFPSKLEKSYYGHLKELKASGEVKYFLRQVPFYLPGGVTYRVDFQIFLSDGTVQYVDCKGINTPVSTVKIKLVEALYPVKIKIVRK